MAIVAQQCVHDDGLILARGLSILAYAGIGMSIGALAAAVAAWWWTGRRTPAK